MFGPRNGAIRYMLRPPLMWMTQLPLGQQVYRPTPLNSSLLIMIDLPPCTVRGTNGSYERLDPSM